MVIYQIISCVSLAYVMVGCIVAFKICRGLSKAMQRKIRLSPLFRLTIIASWPLALSLIESAGINLWN